MKAWTKDINRTISEDKRNKPGINLILRARGKEECTKVLLTIGDWHCLELPAHENLKKPGF